MKQRKRDKYAAIAAGCLIGLLFLFGVFIDQITIRIWAANASPMEKVLARKMETDLGSVRRGDLITFESRTLPRYCMIDNVRNREIDYSCPLARAVQTESIGVIALRTKHIVRMGDPRYDRILRDPSQFHR